MGSRGNSVSIVSAYRLDDIFDPRQRQSILPLAFVSRPTEHPIQWVPGILFPGVKCDRGVTLTTHPHLVPRSR
jgi:hypothetical protein